MHASAASWLVVISRSPLTGWTWSVRRNGVSEVAGDSMDSYDATLSTITAELQRRGTINLCAGIPAERLVVEPVGDVPRRRPSKATALAA